MLDMFLLTIIWSGAYLSHFLAAVVRRIEDTKDYADG